MTAERRPPLQLDARELAAFELLRSVGPNRASRRVLEVDGRRHLVSVDSVLSQRLYLVTLHAANDADAISFSRSMAVVQIERARPVLGTEAPDPYGLLHRVLAEGASFDETTGGMSVSWCVYPAVLWPPESLRLAGPLAQYTRGDGRPDS